MEFGEIIQHWEKKRFISLLSGGLDSPVATHLMMEKGYDCICVNFLIGSDFEKSKKKMLKIGKHLNSLSESRIAMVFFKHNEILKKFISRGQRKLTCLLCKRYMLRVAAVLAQKTGASFIVNGDILGEQASQTLDNLVQVQKVLQDTPVIRPLIGFEKLEVIKKSRKLGLYDLSILPEPGCDYNPKYPETHARISEIIASEKGIDYQKIINSVVQGGDLVILK